KKHNPDSTLCKEGISPFIFHDEWDKSHLIDSATYTLSKLTATDSSDPYYNPTAWLEILFAKFVTQNEIKTNYFEYKNDVYHLRSDADMEALFSECVAYLQKQSLTEKQNAELFRLVDQKDPLIDKLHAHIEALKLLDKRNYTLDSLARKRLGNAETSV